MWFCALFCVLALWPMRLISRSNCSFTHEQTDFIGLLPKFVGTNHSALTMMNNYVGSRWACSSQYTSAATTTISLPKPLLVPFGPPDMIHSDWDPHYSFSVDMGLTTGHYWKFHLSYASWFKRIFQQRPSMNLSNTAFLLWTWLFFFQLVTYWNVHFCKKFPVLCDFAKSFQSPTEAGLLRRATELSDH